MPRLNVDRKGRSWVSYGKEDFPSGSGSGIGCFVLITGFIGLAIVLAILLIFNLVFLTLYDIFNNLFGGVYENVIVKIIFYPSTFDLYHQLFEERYFLKFLLLLVGLLVLAGFYFLVNSKKFLRIYITTNIVVLAMRALFALTFATMLLAETETVTNEAVMQKGYEIEKVEKTSNLTYEADTYSIEELVTKWNIPEALLNEDEVNAMWVETKQDKSMPISFSANFAFYDENILKSGFINHPKYANRFQTTLVYIPTDEAFKEHRSITISFIGDNQLIETFTISKDEPIVKVDIPMDVENTFRIKIESDLISNARITLLATTFSYEF